MLSIRPATIQDAPLLNIMIHELAQYDRLGDEAGVTEEAIARDGFGPRARNSAPSLRNGADKRPGMRCFFEFYSTFQGRAGLFLDDLFVRPPFRKQGIGRALLAHVAGIAWKEDYFCIRWEVLDWNSAAIGFYRELGAVFLDEWRAALLIGDALQAVAEEKK